MQSMAPNDNSLDDLFKDDVEPKLPKDPAPVVNDTKPVDSEPAAADPARKEPVAPEDDVLSRASAYQDVPDVKITPAAAFVGPEHEYPITVSVANVEPVVFDSADAVVTVSAADAELLTSIQAVEVSE